MGNYGTTHSILTNFRIPNATFDTGSVFVLEQAGGVIEFSGGSVNAATSVTGPSILQATHSASTNSTISYVLFTDFSVERSSAGTSLFDVTENYGEVKLNSCTFTENRSLLFHLERGVLTDNHSVYERTTNSEKGTVLVAENDASATFTGSQMNENASQESGGVVAALDFSHITMASVYATKNSASATGGVFYIENSSIYTEF